MTDERIAKNLRDKDEATIAFVIDKYSKLLWKVAGAVLANASVLDVEECVADVFVDLWQNPEKYNPSKSKLSSYLSMVARSKAVDRYRKIARRHEENLEEKIKDDIRENKGLLQNVIEAEEREILLACLKKLNDEDKDILLRRYYYEQKPKEIAVALNMPKKQVENRLYLTKQRLRDMMKEEGYAEV